MTSSATNEKGSEGSSLSSTKLTSACEPGNIIATEIESTSAPTKPILQAAMRHKLKLFLIILMLLQELGRDLQS